MTFRDTLAQERVRARVSQRELARRVGVSESTVRAYEAGRREIPADVAAAAVRALGSPRLRAARCFECQVNLLNPPWLDLVDTHPQVVRDKLLEELDEASSALRQVVLINRRTPDSLTADDRQRLAKAIDGLRDLYPGLLMFFGILETDFGFDHQTMAAALHRKLISRGYTSAGLPQYALKEVA